MPSPDSPVPEQPNFAGQPSDPAGSTPELPWLQDVSLAAQHLARLSLETAAQAALIVQKSQLWAYAGELPQPAAEELAQVITSYWEKANGSDLARFVRLRSTGGEYMLYATGLPKAMVLALVFNVETPFSKIRSQAGRLARALASPPSETGEDTLVVDAWLPESEPEASLFDDVPPPSVPAPKPSSPPVSAQPEPKQNTVDEHSAEEADLPDEDAGDEMEEQANDSQPAAVSFQPASPAVYNLNYACLLIPRLPNHHLTGDLAARLSEWLPQLCVSFGWRLVHLAIRPEYMQWVIDLPPNTSPGYLMRIFRQQTSRCIFDEFPRMARDNPSGDFWAPGYLIMSSSQPLPGPVMKEYIKQTRTRQGA